MDNKSCENCYYFNRHFVCDGTRFKYAHCGHCMNFDISVAKRRSKKDFTACTMWAPIEKLKSEKREKLITAMKNAAQDLSDILDVLQSDFFE